MVVRFTLTNEIAQPVARVFDAARDIDLHVDSMSGTREQAVAGVTSGLIGPGQTVTWRARHFGLWLRLTSRITEYDRPHCFVDEQVEGPFAMFRHEHRFTESDDGGTLMTDVIEFEAPLGVLGILAEGLVLSRYMTRLIETRDEQLIAVLEPDAGDSVR